MRSARAALWGVWRCGMMEARCSAHPDYIVPNGHMSGHSIIGEPGRRHVLGGFPLEAPEDLIGGITETGGCARARARLRMGGRRACARGVQRSARGALADGQDELVALDAERHPPSVVVSGPKFRVRVLESLQDFLWLATLLGTRLPKVGKIGSGNLPRNA